MPIYEFYCKICDRDFEILKKGDNYFECQFCKQVCEKLVSRVSMQPDYFWSGVDYPGLTPEKRLFTSKKEWENTMKANGRVVYEDGMFDKIPANGEERRKFRAKKRKEKYGKDVENAIVESMKETNLI